MCTQSSNNHNNHAQLNQQPCLSSPFSCPSRFHVSQTGHGSRTTHTLNARTPTRELHARSPAGEQALASPRASKRRRTRARSPQPSQGEAKSSLLHRDRDGRQAACANETHAKHGKGTLGNQSHARRKEGQAGLVVTRPNFHSDIPSACMLHAARCCSPPLPYILPAAAAAALRTTTTTSLRSGACTCTTSSKRMAALAGARPRTCPRHSHRAVLRRCLGATCDGRYS